MPMHEQILRKEQDPFHKVEDQNASAQAQAATASRQRVEAQERLTTASEPVAHEAVAPSVLAHLPGQTGASDEAVKQLFNHFSERERKGGQSAAEEAQKTSSTQTDPRTSSRARDPRGSLDRKAGDEFRDGFAADFMPDSQFVGADLDDRPRADEAVDVWEGTSGRRKKRASTATTASKKSKKGEGK